MFIGRIRKKSSIIEKDLQIIIIRKQYVVNLGGDADTNAAVSCALLGAKYGFSSIPQYYVDNLQNKQIMEEIYQNTILDLNE